MDNEAVIARFLAPMHVAGDIDIDRYSASAVCETPGADAWCRILVHIEDGRIIKACFRAFGPPATIAAADWLCENVQSHTVESATQLDGQAVARGLALTAEQRHVGLLVVDALAKALSNLGR